MLLKLSKVDKMYNSFVTHHSGKRGAGLPKKRSLQDGSRLTCKPHKQDIVILSHTLAYEGTDWAAEIGADDQKARHAKSQRVTQVQGV